MKQQNFSQEDIKKIAKGTGVTLTGSSVGRGIFFLSQIIIARFLGVEVFGLYALGFATVKICEIIARLGLNTGGMRFVSIYKDEDTSRLKGTLISATVLSLLFGLLIGIALFFLATLIAQNIYHKPELAHALQLFAISIPFLSGMAVVSSLLQGFHTTKYTIYTREIIQPFANIIFILAFYYTGFGLHGVIGAFIFSHLFAVVAGIYFIRKTFPEFVKKDIKPVYELKNLISYSAPLLFVGFLQYLLSWTDTLMLGFLSTTREVGIYRAAAQVPFIMTVFLMATNSIYAPLAADLYKKGELERLSNIFKISTRWVSYASIPMFIFLALSAKEILSFFGKGYVETGSVVLIVLSFGQLVNCITGGVGYTLTMTGKQKIELFNSLALVGLDIVLNLFLIPKYGAMGAAISTGISVIIINIVRFVEVFFLYKMIPFSLKTAKIIVPAVISALIFWFVRIDFHPNIKILILFSSITTIFVFSLYIMKISEEDMFVINRFKSKLTRVFR